MKYKEKAVQVFSYLINICLFDLIMVLALAILLLLLDGTYFFLF